MQNLQARVRLKRKGASGYLMSGHGESRSGNEPDSSLPEDKGIIKRRREETVGGIRELGRIRGNCRGIGVG